MLRRVVQAVLERVGGKRPVLELDSSILVSTFARYLALAGCVGRCHMTSVGIGIVVTVTLAQARNYNIKLLAVVAQVAIERVREEFDVDIKAVYWRHEISLGIKRLTLADRFPSGGEALRTADEGSADDPWDGRHRHHHVEVKEIDLAEFETALQARQEQPLTRDQTAS